MTQGLRYLGLWACRALFAVIAIVALPCALVLWLAEHVVEFALVNEERLELSIRGNRISRARRRLEKAIGETR